jgi:hypothetical protein
MLLLIGPIYTNSCTGSMHLSLRILRTASFV